MKILIIVIVGTLFLTCSCKKVLGIFKEKDDELSLKQSSYFDGALRIDGYYYLDNGDNRDYYFFYENGIVLGGVTSKISELSSQEVKMKNGEYYSSVSKFKYFWGIFNIEEKEIKFEKWYPSSGGGFKAYVRSGIILNDTTFRITSSYRANDKDQEVDRENETYHFKEFSPKPDSTNKFVK